MLSDEDNDLITRVEGDAPMGQMIRWHHWIPAVRAARPEAGKPPFGTDPSIAYERIRAESGIMPADESWRTYFASKELA